MNKEGSLFDLARQVEVYETQGMHISQGWYEFEQGKREDIEELSDLSNKSLSTLTQLASGLAKRIRGLTEENGNRERLQYAYNLTQELIQSRQANQEMLHAMINGHQYKECFRALSIKEKGAYQQVTTLRETLENVIQ